MTSTIALTSTRTPDMMPLLGQKGAPTKFRGHYEEVKQFIRHFNQLCKAYGVSDDKDKCERVVDYCSSKVVKLIEALPSYQTNDWTNLETDLLTYYDADLKDTRYIVRDLLALTRHWKVKQIKTLTKWRKYVRKFTTVAGWLEAKKKISEGDKASYFWHGINKQLRQNIEIRLITGAKPLDIKSPFPVTEVCKVAERIFERNRFDINLADSDSDVPSRMKELDSESSDESSLDEDEDSDDYVYTRKSKSKAKKVSTKKSHKAKEESDDETFKRSSKKTTDRKTGQRRSSSDKKQNGIQDEVESLIKQMSNLSLDDPKYPLIYYRALKLDADVAHCVKPP